MVSILSCILLNGGGACCPVLPGSVCVAWLVPRPVQCMAVSTAIMLCTVSLPGAWCEWCMSLCGVCVVGCPAYVLPLAVVEGGALRGGGWHGEGRAAVLWVSPSVYWCPLV